MRSTNDNRHTQTFSLVFSLTHAQTHKQTDAVPLSHIHKLIKTHPHSYAHTNTHTQTHTHTHALTHTHMHIDRHRHIHVHTQLLTVMLFIGALGKRKGGQREGSCVGVKVTLPPQ